MPAVDAAPWAAPLARVPVDAVVALPGSKSLTNRALVVGALATEPSVLRGALRSRDTLLMAEALRRLGAGVDVSTDDWRVQPAVLRGPATVDCGLAGTVMRFIPPVATLAEGPVRLDGDPRARERPLGPLITALRTLGADVVDDGRGALPLRVHGHGSLPGGPVSIDASASSQLVSGLLLAAARFRDGVDVRHVGPPVPSAPHLAMTVDVLRRAGAQVQDGEPDRWRVAPGPLRGLDIAIEPDLSNAAPFLAAALVTGGRVTVADWPSETTQAGAALMELLSAFGADCVLDGHGLTVTGPQRLAGIEVDLRDVSELAPVITAIAALAATPTRIIGIAHVRGHETDRIAALARELNRLGGDVRELPDGLDIRPRRLHGGLFETYDDHRLATAAAVLGLVVADIAVADVATTAKTLPGFVDLWRTMLEARS